MAHERPPVCRNAVTRALIVLASLLLLQSVSGWAATAPAGPEIRINEVVSSNRGSIADEDSDFSDWIEIRNVGNSKVNLQGFGLSDDLSEPFQWQFPGIKLDPEQTLLVFASGKNRLSAVPMQPDKVAGLQLWLKADMPGMRPEDSDPTSATSSVAVWPDQSGAEHHLRQPQRDARPTWLADGLNGKPTVRFDGRRDYLRLNYSSRLNPESLTLFAIAKKRGGTGFQTIILSRSTQFSGYNLYANPDNRWSFWTGIGSSWKKLASGQPIAPQSPYLLSATYSGYQAAFNIDGQEVDMATVPIRPNTARPFYLGAGAKRSGEPALFFNGDISEVVIYDRRLDKRRRKRVEQYLAQKYRLTLHNRLHTNFKIDADGETLLLTSPDGKMVDQLRVPSIRPGLSYGRTGRSPKEATFFLSPSPESPNPKAGYTKFARPPRFSRKAGFYEESVNLELSPQAPTAEVHYTLNGGPPTQASPRYSRPIPLETNAVVRARAFSENAVPSEIVTRTYFVGEEPSLPVVSLAADPDHFWGEEAGIYTHFDPSFEGRRWERPVHVEFFEPDQTFGIGFNAGIRMHGGIITTKFPQKSLRLYMRGEYGRHAVEYPFFPDHDVTRFRRLILRNAGQDWMVAHFRDALMQDLIDGIDTLDTQAYRPVITFINGRYWGIYNLRERIDEDHLASKHRVHPDKVDLLENKNLPNQGSPDHYLGLLRFISNHPVQDPATLEAIGNMMDLRNFIDYAVSEIYFANTDWPGQNLRYWRLRSPHAKWRWLIFDTDFGFGLKAQADHDTLKFATATGSQHYANPDWATFLPRKLLSNPSFRARFVNRLADLLNTKFRPQRVVERINGFANRLEAAMPRQISRWGGRSTEIRGEAVPTMAAWREEVDRLRDFARNRPKHLQRDVLEHFNLAATSKLAIDVNPPQAGSVSVNTLTMGSDSLPWHGTYFQGVSVRLTAQPAKGFEFVRWQGDVKSASASVRLELATDSRITAVFESSVDSGSPSKTPARLLVSEIMYHPPESEALEFVELHNVGRTPIDLSHARFVDGIELELPEGAVLPANGFGLVVNDAPFNNFARVRAYYGIDSGTPIWGPFEGNLSNGGERVAIASNSARGSPGQLLDEVTYTDEPPWPAEQSDGNGESLHRRMFHKPKSESGNAPMKWVSDTPSGGYSHYLDDDGDDIPSVWENRNGLSPRSASDGNEDPDGDGLVNRDEYLAGTDPRDKQSSIRIEHLGLRTGPEGPEMLLQVPALPRHDFRLEHRRRLHPHAGWTHRRLPTKPFASLIQVIHKPSSAADRQFYRLWLSPLSK